ncbi:MULTISPECIES: hypothetical protein [Calothrix]|uniref:Uncharacterized protein n=2 Tax=Calothrix TaxID=1186 RepID=A0ABR8A3H6_9CYAN|nr:MULTISPECIES: hypothetical protein [Calothrix]MBD2194480.1 hypothetical protein [Calothrix parietina FACHB-288]MBD2223414.1 hypothetical protein [Calothrix anomala FACHB-343]
MVVIGDRTSEYLQLAIIKFRIHDQAQWAVDGSAIADNPTPIKITLEKGN